jgi:hypothetical protein
MNQDNSSAGQQTTPWETVEPVEPILSPDFLIDGLTAEGLLAEADAERRAQEVIAANEAGRADAIEFADASANAARAESPVPLVAAPEPTGGAFTIPLLCAGLALLACCLLIPQADANRRLAYQRETLRRDLEQIQKQLEVNNEFIKKVSEDPALAERLAQRQMKLVREGTRVLELKGEEDNQISPFLLVNVPPPEPLPPYQARGGFFSSLFRHPKSQLYLMGGGMMMIATGLVMGSSLVSKRN